MKRRLFLVFMVACLSAGCAAHRASEAEVIAETAAHPQPSRASCRDLWYCETEGTGEQHCACLDQRKLIGRW